MNWKLAKTISDLPSNVMPGKNRKACLLCSDLKDEGRLVLAEDAPSVEQKNSLLN